MDFFTCSKSKYMPYFSARRDFRHAGTDVNLICFVTFERMVPINVFNTPTGFPSRLVTPFTAEAEMSVQVFSVAMFSDGPSVRAHFNAYSMPFHSFVQTLGRNWPLHAKIQSANHFGVGSTPRTCCRVWAIALFFFATQG